MTRQRSDEHRKQQIRNAATRCFVRRGYAATRLVDIAKQAGLSKGGVYFHYRAKEQLFHDCVEGHVRELAGRWGFDPEGDRPAQDVMHSLVIAHLRLLEDEPDQTGLFNLLVGLAAQDEEFRSNLTQAFEILERLYTKVIAAGIEQGTFRGGDPQVLARLVVAMLTGLGAYSARDPEGRLSLDHQTTVAHVLGMLGAPATTAVEQAAADSAQEPDRRQPGEALPPGGWVSDVAADLATVPDREQATQ